MCGRFQGPCESLQAGLSTLCWGQQRCRGPLTPIQKPTGASTPSRKWDQLKHLKAPGRSPHGHLFQKKKKKMENDPKIVVGLPYLNTDGITPPQSPPFLNG